MRDGVLPARDRETVPAAFAASLSAAGVRAGGASRCGCGAWEKGREGEGILMGGGKNVGPFVCLTCHIRTSNSLLSMHPAVPTRVGSIG